jgi:hypothetical protein
MKKSSNGLHVYQTGMRSETRAFNFYGNAAYVLHLIITINLPHFAIASFGLELPWESYVWWLDEPDDVDGRVTMYRFDRSYPLEFEKSQVLNHFTGVRRTWSRGKSLVGYLLGIGAEPIPDQFQQGATIPAVLIIYDQLERDYRSPVSFWTDRHLQPTRRPGFAIRPEGNLLDIPDARLGHAALGNEDEGKK